MAPVMGEHNRPCEACSTVLLTRLAKQVYRHSDEEQMGIHARLLIALSYLRDHNGAPQQELAEALCMDANNVVLLLNELEDLAFVERRRDPEDRRRHRVEITPEGRRALESAERAQSSIEDEILQALDEDERTTLRSLLARAPSPTVPTPTARRSRLSRRRHRAAAERPQRSPAPAGAPRRRSRRPR
jgi:DNA-binding MarR family transcriptional regulator